MSKLEKFIEQAKELVKKEYTSSTPEFIAWNNSLIRYMENNYGIDSTVTKNFKNRSYTATVFALGHSDSYFIDAYQKDMKITLRELEILLDEESDVQITSIPLLTNNKITNLSIIEDMKDIEKVLSNNIEDLSILRRLHKKIDSKYQVCIKDWYKSMYAWNQGFGFNYEMLDKSSLIENLETMLFKLSAYSMNLNSISKEDNMIIQPIINNTNNNNNNMNIQLNFNDIRKNFENDNTYTLKEKNEIIEKLNELEKIYYSKEFKSKKWEMICPILAWILNRSVEVGIAFLPIIYQIIQQ